MTIPTDKALLDILWDGLSPDIKEEWDYNEDDLEAIAAVRKAIIEALAEEAYTKALHRVHKWSDANTDWLEVPDWLRSHL